MKATIALAMGSLLLTGCAELPFGDGEGSFAAAKSQSTIPANVREEFNRLDVDGDGFIDPTEATSSSEISGNFSTYDTNTDGVISLEEYAARVREER